jgi:hypothetical protein
VIPIGADLKGIAAFFAGLLSPLCGILPLAAIAKPRRMLPISMDADLRATIIAMSFKPLRGARFAA